MMAASLPIQRPKQARLLAVDREGQIRHLRRTAFADLLRSDDLVIANDAATIPASLTGIHQPTGAAIEVRLAGRRSLAARDVHTFTAIVFGAGDYRIRTEHRPPPPPLTPGHSLRLGPLTAVIEELLGHPRLVRLCFAGTPTSIWAGIAQHGKPIQYAHLANPLALWDVWTPIAGPPAAFEPPSAGFPLDWQTLAALQTRGVAFATLTHAAGISSTGDDDLDGRLPFDEPYCIPTVTARALARARFRGGRIIAIGTTVVRALEHAGRLDGLVRPGDGVATQRLGPATTLRIVDALLSGTHAPGTSHYELLRAFTDDATLQRMDDALEQNGYLTHEFGDSVFLERRQGKPGQRGTEPVVMSLLRP